ncbi:hypothetical protein QBC47DRAFT_374962 [Echria macrotheca]|uniref:PQ loop repeat protein n=1 Tax=Echria macrotheca TaxID=438768 RepID=A0AAJ0BJY1_9PEZI|nr:hypothetical protein QBC47DRAFT_374962 [Echria macrotheca]
MAPQTEIPVSNSCADTAKRLWCVQLVPQIWTNWRTKKTDGLPGIMMFLWALCGVPFGVYAILQDFNIALQIQPQMFMSLCLVSWAQILVYHRKWPAWKATVLGIIMACTFAGVEAALIITLRPIYHGGNETPVLVVGIVAAILLAAGLLPPYGEIWKRRGRVIGINWIFLSMDWFGAFFSLMALGMIPCILELGIFLSHLIFLARTRRLRREAAREGKTFDDILAQHDAQGTPFKFAERKGRTWRFGSGQDGETEEASRASSGSETQGYAPDCAEAVEKV